MPDIYEQHSSHFKAVSAYVILKGGERVATIAFKFPADGAGRLYAYVHWLGVPMVRGHAGGYGYDKRSVAVWDAVHRACVKKHELMFAEPGSAMDVFRAELGKDDGQYWDRRLEKAGFTVLQAV